MQEQKPKEKPVTLPIYLLKPRLHRKIISSYKPVLLLHDLAILLISFSLFFFAAGLGPQHQKGGILVLMMVFGLSVFVFIFSVFNLYSYGANFIWRNHFLRMKKALIWVLINFGLFVLLLNWNHLYGDKIVIPLLTTILVLCLLCLGHRFDVLTNLTYAFAICLLSTGTIGLVRPDSIPTLKMYSYPLLNFYVISGGLLLGGRSIFYPECLLRLN